MMRAVQRCVQSSSGPRIAPRALVGPVLLRSNGRPSPLLSCSFTGSSAHTCRSQHSSAVDCERTAADVVVVGAGIAGSAAALQAAEHGLKVLVLTSSIEISECTTKYAQGGLMYRGEEDSPHRLDRDVKAAGAGLCTPAAVAHLCTAGPSCVESFLLDSATACLFDLEVDGTLALREEAGHSCPRVVHVGDETGKAVISSLQDMLHNHPNVRLIPGAVAVDVLRENSRCVGLETRYEGRQLFIAAGETILATGGVGELYSNTSNPASALGDGLGMGLRAGCQVGGMEYVQFHPTTLALAGERRFLISEGIRGAGALLVNVRGERFASWYHPLAEFAPHDVVSRMIVAEMTRTDSPHVYLDMTQLGRSFSEERFPAVFKHCLHRGIDIGTDLIPVMPAQHYHCGGLAVDLAGRTSVPGLRAVGEVSFTGVHGANRLGSTALLEGLVWGKHAADCLAEDLPSMIPGASFSSTTEAAIEAVSSRTPSLLPSEEEAGACDTAVQSLHAAMQSTMWDGVGVLRSSGGLQQTTTQLALLDSQLRAMRARHGNVLSIVRAQNSLAAASAITSAALENTQSAGAHYRVDGVQGPLPVNFLPLSQTLPVLERIDVQEVNDI